MRGPTHSRKWCSSLVRCGGGEGMIRRRIIGGTGRTGDQGIDKSKSPHQVRNRGTGAKNGSQEREPRSESGSHVLHGFWLTLAGRRSGHGCLKASPRVEVHQAWGQGVWPEGPYSGYGATVLVGREVIPTPHYPCYVTLLRVDCSRKPGV